MIGVQVIYILLFSTIQLGVGGFLLKFRRRKELKQTAHQAIMVTIAFLCYNIAALLNISKIPLVVETIMLFLPTCIFYYFSSRIPQRNRNGRGIHSTRIIAALSLIITVALWLTLRQTIGLGISSIITIMLVVYTCAGFVISIHFQLTQIESLKWLVTVLIAAGFGIIVLTGFLIPMNGSVNSQVIVNFIYLGIISEFIVRNYTIYFRSKLHNFGNKSEDKFASENKLVTKYPALDKFKLTKSQRYTAEGLLDGFSFQELSNMSGRSVNTLYQHAHQAYRKTHTVTQQTFLLTFRNAEQCDIQTPETD